MTCWWISILEQLRERLRDDVSWLRELDAIEDQDMPRSALHLAVFVEPYLQFVLDGKKTVESRFSSNRCAPFGVIRPGDLVLLKRSGGPVEGICQIADVWSYRLDPASSKEIRGGFGKQLCISDPEFWSARKNASYATLMRIQRTRKLPPIAVQKRDRRGWVLLRNRRDEQPLLDAVFGRTPAETSVR